MGKWHGEVMATGDQSYSHLASVMHDDYRELARHLKDDHHMEPSGDPMGAWCRDAERHAADHGVTLHG